MNIRINFKLRLEWINLYGEVQNIAVVCEHFGISKVTLRKWLKRYQEKGEKGLVNLSSKPNSSPMQKRNASNDQIILNLRNTRQLGARRIQSELQRNHNISFSLSTIHKTLKLHQIPNLNLKRHYYKQHKRYNCKIPGERIQMDVCKIAKSLYHFDLAPVK